MIIKEPLIIFVVLCLLAVVVQRQQQQQIPPLDFQAAPPGAARSAAGASELVVRMVLVRPVPPEPPPLAADVVRVDQERLALPQRALADVLAVHEAVLVAQRREQERQRPRLALRQELRDARGGGGGHPGVAGLLRQSEPARRGGAARREMISREAGQAIEAKVRWRSQGGKGTRPGRRRASSGPGSSGR